MIINYLRSQRIKNKINSLAHSERTLLVPNFQQKKITLITDLNVSEPDTIYKSYEWILKNWKCEIELIYYCNEKVDKLRTGIQLNDKDFFLGVQLKKDKLEQIKNIQSSNFILVFNPLGNPYLHLINSYLEWDEYCIAVDSIQLQWYDIMIKQIESASIYTFIQSLDMLVHNLNKHELSK
jgi:hypothetical protein